MIGISTSSQALIKDKLSALGTNLLTVTAGTDVLGQDAPQSGGNVDRLRISDRLWEMRKQQSAGLVGRQKRQKLRHMSIEARRSESKSRQ